MGWGAFAVGVGALALLITGVPWRTTAGLVLAGVVLVVVAGVTARLMPPPEPPSGDERPNEGR